MPEAIRDDVQIAIVDVRPMLPMRLAGLEPAQEAPERQQDLACRAVEHQDVAFACPVAVRSEVEAQADAIAVRLEMEEITVRFEMPPDAGGIAARCGVQRVDQSSDRIVRRVRGVDVDADAGGLDRQRQPPVPGGRERDAEARSGAQCAYLALPACTASTSAATWSGFMSGERPWPRLKTWLSREPPVPAA